MFNKMADIAVERDKCQGKKVYLYIPVSIRLVPSALLEVKVKRFRCAGYVAQLKDDRSGVVISKKPQETDRAVINKKASHINISIMSFLMRIAMDRKG